MLSALFLISLGIMGVVGLAVEAMRWPCGRCHRRILPWVKSCKPCLEKMARRFR